MATTRTTTIEALQRSIDVINYSANSLAGFNEPVRRQQLKIAAGLEKRLTKLQMEDKRES